MVERLGHMFELRTLRYFLAFVQEGGISNASKALHITQPTLSRQLADLERNVGRPLYEKTGGYIHLTHEGRVLYDRAKAIVELSDQAEEELAGTTKNVSGTVRIGAGESIGMKVVARAIRRIQADYPDLTVHLSSGFTMDHLENLERGVLDFVLECETVGRPGYGALEFPVQDRWVALMPEDDPLAAHEYVEPQDFEGANVTMSRQALKVGKMKEWFGDSLDKVHVVATHNLTVNSTFICRERMGYVFTYEGLYTVPGLVSRPFMPELYSKTGLIWVNKRTLSLQAQTFLDYLRAECDDWAD
ncbi:LysR family transcriptional regulator [Slackia heliotrinireducens]|uniref:LysR family transcriptional regulator n=1 Tax=Slackia heliotrinireducens TaxID=84110 RepID=UPI00331585F5